MAKKKNKTNRNKNVDPSEIPAYVRFANPDYDTRPYEWEGWGLVIRHIRLFTDMDQAIFGRLVKGYNRGQIARYETEQAEPPIDFWSKLSMMFGLNINWIFTGKGLPYTFDHADSEERKRFYRWERLKDEKENFMQDLYGH